MVEESQIAQEICQMFGIRVSVSQVCTPLFQINYARSARQ